MKYELTPTQRKALHQILALKRLQNKNRTLTTKSQNQILGALCPEDLAQVAIALLDPEVTLESIMKEGQ